MPVPTLQRNIGKSRRKDEGAENGGQMLKEVIEVFDLLDHSEVSGKVILNLLQGEGAAEIKVKPIKDKRGSTEVIEVLIPGLRGASRGGKALTLGVVGTLAGVGARPAVQGIVSDGDGAIAALACALKLLRMRKRGDNLEGDVMITTHICPKAPTEPHDPVPFVRYPVRVKKLMKYLVDDRVHAILSIDTTKGNRILNYKGFAISPTVKEGFILRVSEDLLDIMQITTGRLPVVLPITTQDITPYENGLHHLNSIMQPSTVTKAPVVGVAITTESGVPGCATGASHPVEIETAARFVIEVAKLFTRGKCHFYDRKEFEKIVKIYGRMSYLQAG